VVAATLMAAVFFASAPARSAAIGEPAPDFSLPTLEEREIGLGKFKGKVVLLNFWASWCAPCQEELPELEKIYRKYQERGFEVIGVNIDKKQANAEKFVRRFGLTFPVMLDPESAVVGEYRAHAMPMSYLIDQEGVIRQLFFGFNRKKLPAMEAAVVEVMGATSD
jgi:peroxiredoxin